MTTNIPEQTNPYHTAVELGKYAWVKKYVDTQPMASLITGASIASDRGHFRIVNLLLDRGVPPRMRDDVLMHNALRYGHLPTVKRLHEAGCELTGLLTCVYWGYKPCFDYHLDQGVDVTHNYNEALQVAVSRDAYYYIDQLIEKGARLNYQCLLVTKSTRIRKYLATKTQQYELVFIYACDIGDRYTVAHIVRYNNVCHFTGILHATERGHLDIVKILSKYVSLQHSFKIMFIASNNNHFNIVDYYVQVGINPFLNNGVYTNVIIKNAILNHNVTAFKTLFENQHCYQEDDDILRWCMYMHSLLLIDYVLSKRVSEPEFDLVGETITYRNQFMVEIVSRYVQIPGTVIGYLLGFCDVEFVSGLIERGGLQPVINISELDNKYAQAKFRALVLRHLVDYSGEGQCPVCFSESVDCKVEGCGHVYHKECIEPWLETSNTCPSCRSVLI